MNGTAMKSIKSAGYLQKNRNNSGFTLKEVLVVTAIAGILMSILLPVLAKAKLRAIRTVCLNNVKQLSFAYFSYAQDHGNTIPFSAEGGNSGWVDMLKDGYGIAEDTLHCPLCEKSNQHSFGGMRKEWRVGGEALPVKAKSKSKTTSVAGFAPAKPAPNHEWARHPNYWKFVTGNFGNKKRAKFTINLIAPGCCEHGGKHDPHPCSSRCPNPHPASGPDCPLGGKPKQKPKSKGSYCKKKQGGEQLVLVICENVKPSNFGLEIFNAKTGKRLQETRGVTIDDCELFEWKGPLARGLGGEGSLLGPSSPYHKIPVGFDRAMFVGQEQLYLDQYYPNPPIGTGRVNYIYMRTTIRSTVDVSLKVAVSGDEAYSVFMLKGNCCPGGPGTPCQPGKPTTSSYGINEWAQSGHHYARHQPHKFIEHPEGLTSGVPVIAEANWASIMPTPNDIPPKTLDGGRYGIQRVILDRHDKHINMGYGDGHAESVKLRETYGQEWYKGCKMPRGLTVPKLPEE